MKIFILLTLLMPLRAHAIGGNAIPGQALESSTPIASASAPSGVNCICTDWDINGHCVHRECLPTDEIAGAKEPAPRVKSPAPASASVEQAPTALAELFEAARSRVQTPDAVVEACVRRCLYWDDNHFRCLRSVCE